MSASPRFPQEVVRLILCHLPQQELATMCTLSKTLRVVVEAALYRTAVVGPKALAGWCGAILDSEPDSGRARETRVLTLAMADWLFTGSAKEQLQRALGACVNLRQLHVVLQAGQYFITAKDDPQLWLLFATLPCQLTHFTAVAPFMSQAISVASTRFFASPAAQTLTALSLPNCCPENTPDLSCLPNIVSLTMTAKGFEAARPSEKGWELQSVQLYLTFNDVARLRLLAPHAATLTSLALVRDAGTPVPTTDMLVAIAQWVPGIQRLCITETGTIQPRRDEPVLHTALPLLPQLRELVLQFHRAQATFFVDPDPPVPRRPRALPIRRSTRHTSAPPDAPGPSGPAPLRLTRPADRRKLGALLMAAAPGLRRFELGADVFIGPVDPRLAQKWLTAVWARFPSEEESVQHWEVRGRVWDAQSSFSVS
ncbi:hypothetical protein MIND_00630100 [Mycena indigotica]|uniref:F-box domain-containing protein n=1 Tax=Mycena indigotica TaxID=2126181 RepID=A0A8H6SS14_9AGAR|nr:uncharacterized protein MIND_00630100 [Mycena indigotica]KAF7303990.1 hypothetical protein MIND_00630100 [Mycena indigotica]